MSLRMHLVNRLVVLAQEKKKLEEKLKEVKKQIEKLHEPIIQDMQDNGLKNIALANGATLVQRRDVFCSKRAGVPMPLLCQVLKNHKFEDYVAETYSTAGLKEWIREQEAEFGIPDNGPATFLPDEVRELVKVSTRTQVVVMNAGSATVTKTGE